MSKQDNRITVEFDIQTVVKVMLIIVGLILAINIFDKVLPTIILVATSFFLALALNPAVSKIAHMLPSKSRKIATGAAFFLVVSFLSAFFTLTVPPVANQVADFASDLPATVEDFKKDDNFLSRAVERYDLEDDITEGARSVASRVSNAEGVGGVFNSFISTVINTVVVLVMTFMMLVEGPYWMSRVWGFSDKKKLKHRQKLASKMYDVVTGYVNGQLLIAAIAASISLIFMLIIGAPNALAMAGIVAVLGLIPLIGSTLAAAVIVLSTLLVDVKIAIILGIFFLIYQQIENATIQPYIQGKKSSLTALTVFVAALIGVSLAGLFGAFVAIPVAGCAKVLFDDYMGEETADEKELQKKLL